MVTIAQIIKNSEEILKNNNIESFSFDTRCIVEDVLNMNFQLILLNSSKEISEDDEKKISEMIKKRAENYPLQYILGEWEFYGLPFKVGEGVLIPRPDTETLVDTVLEYCKNKSEVKIIDLCSGSGCIAITLEKNTLNSDVYAVEISDNAYKYLDENISLNNSSVKAVKGDVLSEKTALLFENADVIVSNPPYLTKEDMENLQKEVSFEPEKALFGNNDGLEFYRLIPKIWNKCLKKGGLMAFEIGIGQENDVIEFMKENGFVNIETQKDLAGIVRVVCGVKYN